MPGPPKTGTQGEIEMFKSLLKHVERRRALTDLMKLDDHMLRDIGLTRADLVLMRNRRIPSPSRGHE